MKKEFEQDKEIKSFSEENGLRPLSLNDFMGQGDIKKSLRVFIDAAKIRNGALDHVLFYGPAGLGKTTLAQIIANEMDAKFHYTSGPALTRVGDLASILASLKKGDCLFIDEIHRLNTSVEESLYSVMEDFILPIVLGKGSTAKTISLKINPFTLIGATTRFGLLSRPLRDRFGIILRLTPYDSEELTNIVERAAKVLKISIDNKASLLIASRSRGIPRVAIRNLKRIWDFSLVSSNKTITKEVVEDSLIKLKIDKEGLLDIDREFLETIIYKFLGGPVGIETLASILGEDRGTIEDVVEPYLLQINFIQKTPKGRIVTDEAYKYLKIEKKTSLKQKETEKDSLF